MSKRLRRGGGGGGEGGGAGLVIYVHRSIYTWRDPPGFKLTRWALQHMLVPDRSELHQYEVGSL